MESIYRRLEYRFTYLRTAAGAEIDLVVERPDRSLALIEIESATRISHDHVSTLLSVASDFPEASLICISQDPVRQRFGPVFAIPWQEAWETVANGSD